MNIGYWDKDILHSMKGLAFELCMLQEEETIITFNKVDVLSANTDFQAAHIRATAHAPTKVGRYLSVYKARLTDFVALANSYPWTKWEPS